MLKRFEGSDPATRAMNEVLERMHGCGQDDCYACGDNKKAVVSLVDAVKAADTPSDGSLLLTPPTVMHLYEALISGNGMLHGLRCDVCVVFRAALETHAKKAHEDLRAARRIARDA